MSDIKFALLVYLIIDIIIVVCVTIAAIRFNNYGILWWYLLILLNGIKLRCDTEDKGDKNNAESKD